MRVVFDAVALNGMSFRVVVERWLEGWASRDTGDELHVVTSEQATVDLPDSVHLHRVAVKGPGGRIRAQNTALPRICREVGADVLIGVVPSTAMAPLPCPRLVAVHDMRHELRPEQFSTKARLARTWSYNWGYRSATRLVTVSERTRNDLLRLHPEIDPDQVTVALHGSDHVLRWRKGPPSPSPYVLAFGQYANKNTGLLVEAWARRGDDLELQIIGTSAADRPGLQDAIDRHGVGDRITVRHWLDEDEFQECFTGAAIVAFPSDFEGFGIPVVESMRLGIPIVISPEAAMVEVAGGHASVMGGWDPDDLNAAIDAARALDAEAIEAARAHAATYTWTKTAIALRSAAIRTVEEHSRS